MIKNIITFLLIFLIVGEITVRLKNAVNDIPQRQIDEFGIQKYYPNQKGFWRGGTHAWHVNELGWPGVLPKNFDNLITIIGDSFIENFMNPTECHQSAYLGKMLPNYNFLEAGRSGVSFIEAMEITTQLKKYEPITNLIYVNDGDFYQSLVEVAPADDITQFSLKSDSIVFGKMKSPILKKILYNWKFAYFLYNKKDVIQNLFKKKSTVSFKDKMKSNLHENNAKVFDLINYTKKNYDLSKMTLVFQPNSNKDIIEKCRSVGFEIIILNSDNDESWSFENDHHWTCYGHKRAAQQISQQLLNNVFQNIPR